MRTLAAGLLGLGLSLVTGITSAYSGTFYTTGKEFYEGCWQRKTKEKSLWDKAVATTPSESALWTSCTPLVTETMNSIGFRFASSAAYATAEQRALVGFCPDAWTEPASDFFYRSIIETIEKMGGPSVTEKLAPASWVIQRALAERWPRCIDAARP